MKATRALALPLALGVLILAGEFLVIETLRFRALVLGVSLAIAFLLPLGEDDKAARRLLHVGPLLASVALVATVSIAVESRAFLSRSAEPLPRDFVVGTLILLLLVEATRRVVGNALAALAAVSLAYVLAGSALDSMGLSLIAHRGYDVSRLIGTMVMSFEGVFGVPLDVAATTIGLFAIYGAVLEETGAASFFLDLSSRVFARGSSAQAAGRSVTLAGFLMGTVSGSGVATTLALGGASWPLLKRAGFSAENGGAILAAAGIGAIISPPTLGAAAFLIAEFLKISYGSILLMALIPTLLYYLGVLLMIEQDSKALSSTRLSTDDAGTPEAPIFRRAFHLASPVALAIFLAWGFSATRSALLATLIAGALSFLDKRNALQPARALAALRNAGESLAPIVVTTAAAGVLVGALTLTGLGLKLAGLIVAAAHGSRIATIGLSALAVSVLGLSVPVTASYILSAVMVAPALIQAGVPDFAAHMFIFYYAVLSEVSPPTALAPMAAASLTKANPRATMFATWRYTLPAFLVPLLFTASNAGSALLLKGTPLQVLTQTTLATLVLVAFARMYGLARTRTGTRTASAPLPRSYDSPL